MKKAGLFFVIFLIGISSLFALDIPKFTHHYVNDYGKLLTPYEAQSINQVLRTYQDSTSNQLVILTLTSFDDQIDGPLFDFSKAVFTAWGVGQKGKNNGVLLVIVKKLASKNAPGLRIVTGYGSEGPLPDLICKRIVESIRPSINEGNYYQGINSAVSQMTSHLKGEFKADKKSKDEGLSILAKFLVGLIIVVVVVLIIYFLTSIGESDDESSSSNNYRSDGDDNYSRRNSRSNDDDDYNRNIFIASSLDSSDNYSDGGSDSSSSDSGCDCGGGDSGGGGGGD